MSKDQNFKPGTFIHGIGASEALDSTGERLSIDGLDTSSLVRDAVFNYEHKNEQSSHILGKILYANKIFSEKDCKSEEELYFWNKIKIPYVYVMGELFDGVGHSQAKEVAAMLKYDYMKRKKDPKYIGVVNFSIEGSKLHKEGQEITKSLARKVTITALPANKTCIAEIYFPKTAESEVTEKDVKDFVIKKSEEIETNLNKTLTAGSGMGAPSTLTGGEALARYDVEKKLNELPAFKSLVKFLKDKYPDMKDNEAEAMAKYMTAKSLVKAEESLEKMLGLEKSKNVREQKKKVFGSDPNAPRVSDKRAKMMQQIKQFAEDKFKTPMKIASGKRDETGALREDKENQPAFDVFSPEGIEQEKQRLQEYKQKGIKRVDPKPDWRSGTLETQPSPDAAIHELAHLYTAPKDMTIGQFQEHMDKLWGESQSKYGHMQQKKTSGEIQPMSVENPIRRRLGLPANRATKPVKQNERALDYEGDRFVEGKDKSGKKVFYDRQSRLSTPQTKQQVKDIDEGILEFHPEHGWKESQSPDALVNLRGQGRTEEAKQRLRSKFSLGSKKLAASEIAKAKIDEYVPKESRAKFREERNKMEGRDPLASELTSEKGVSDRGIEARRGDTRIPQGKLAHGYGRVFSAEKHKEQAKKYFKDTKERSAQTPKPNLPKSEMGKNEDPKINYRNPVQQARLNTEKQRIRGIVDHFEKKGKQAPEHLLFPKEGDMYHNPMISHDSRVQLHQAVLSEKAKEKQANATKQQKIATAKPFTPSVDPRMGFGGFLMPKRIAKSLKAAEALSKIFELKKSLKLEHYSPKSDLKEIDPKFQSTGVDARAKRSTEHPHSFYYLEGSTPEDLVLTSATTKYKVDAPKNFKIYDISKDELNLGSQVVKENGAFSMDKMHEKIKQNGYHGFTASEHPTEFMRNVVASYQKLPVSSTQKIKGE